MNDIFSKYTNCPKYLLNSRNRFIFRFSATIFWGETSCERDKLCHPKQTKHDSRMNFIIKQSGVYPIPIM